jgi:SPP1 gp7 family putative phage head morphogenesis protein
MKKQAKGIIAIPKGVTEAFKGEVLDEDVKFPRELGVEHPYDFKVTESLYNTFPFVKGAIDKHIDSIVGDFSIECENKNAKVLIENFIKDTNFIVTLRQWALCSLVTGNGFLELDLKNNQVQVIDPKTMYVKRTKKGEVTGYNQYFGMFANYLKNRNNIPIPFNVNQIAHYKCNAMTGTAYGLGLVYPLAKAIANWIKHEEDQTEVSHRKATAPYHIKVGVPGEATNPEDVQAQADNLVYLTNKTEWTTDANVEIKAIDFGNIGEKFGALLDYDTDQLTYGFQVPAVLMGKGNIPEGLAKVQLEAFQRRIKSYQEDIEKIIEEKIFKPWLNNQGIEAEIDICWHLPGETEINNRIDRLSNLLKFGTNISPNMTRMLEIELADALGIDNAEQWLLKPDTELMQKKDANDKITPEEEMENPEAKEEKEIPQPQVPGVQRQEGHNHIEEKISDDIKTWDWTNIQENAGFTYSDYLKSVLKVLKKDEFIDLKALTEKDLELGLLKDSDISKLRIILRDGFKKNKSMREIEKQIRDYIPLKDRLVVKEDGTEQLHTLASDRPNMIARTETLRVANEGLVKTYKDNGIKKVSWLAAISDRTCEQCMALDGQIRTIGESFGEVDKPPLHPMCRCSLLAVTD